MTAFTGRYIAVAWMSVLATALLGQAPAATRPLAEIVPEYIDGDLETAVIPTPQRAECQETAFAAGKVLVVRPDNYHAPETLFDAIEAILGEDAVTITAASGFARTPADTIVFVGRLPKLGPWAELIKSQGLQPLLDEVASKGADGHVIYTAAGRFRGKNAVLLAGNTPAADFWALATLRQMIFTAGGVHYIREGRILDFPRFTYRGNKRPRQWEWRYKANYAWFFSGPNFPEKVALKDYHRHNGAWIHYGDPMRATDREMDQLIAGYQNQDRKRHVLGAKECYGQGCREFVLKFDDTGSALSEPTRLKFSGDYFQALNYFLTGMHRRIKAIDRRNRVFFMPRPYWHNSFEQREFAEALLACGPLPEDMGLSVCGPEVISWTIPTGCLKDFRELYGLEGKAQIYDNFGRGGEYFALTGRDRDLCNEVECLFPERGTPVTRITVYDYLWNPEAYDPGRSLKLAVRELSDRDPRLYKAMWRYVSYYNEHRDFPSCPSQEEVAAKLPEINRGMKARFDAMQALLERSPLAVQTGLRREFWGPEAPAHSYEWGEYARLRRRLEFAPYMLAYGYREGRVASAAGPITVDGRLDESAWKAARPFPALVRPAWGRKEPPGDLAEFRFPAEETTRMKMLYSDTHLYVGVEFGYRTRPALPEWAAELWKDKRPGDRANFAWRVPCIELLLDTTGRREHYYHLVSNVAGLWISTHCRAYATHQTGGWWRPDWKFEFTLGPRSGGFEASIPLADLTDRTPQKGTIWGFQAFRSKFGTVGLFSGSYDRVGGEHGTREFGRIVFD